MNKRQKKKRIPKDTQYCYEIIGRDKENGILYTKRCPYYKIVGYINDAMVVDGKEYPCEIPVVYCSYAKVSSEEDFLLLDDVKVCGERLGKVSF